MAAEWLTLPTALQHAIDRMTAEDATFHCSGGDFSTWGGCIRDTTQTRGAACRYNLGPGVRRDDAL